MIHNLKTRPRCVASNIGDIRRWFEDFEKELKAKREKDAKKCGYDIADYTRISEILGEDHE